MGYGGFGTLCMCGHVLVGGVYLYCFSGRGLSLLFCGVCRWMLSQQLTWSILLTSRR